jgi:predicted butyrate kinase (DUF1464 family)
MWNEIQYEPFDFIVKNKLHIYFHNQVVHLNIVPHWPNENSVFC